MPENQQKSPNQQAILEFSRFARPFDAQYSTDPVFQQRFAIWREAIRRYSAPGQRALDVGCGSGQFLQLLAESNAEVVGVDGSAEMLGLCREQMTECGLGNVRLVQADIAALGELGLEPFDFIIASSVLEYVADFEEVMQAIAGLLRPSGRLLFSIPNRRSLLRRAYPLFYRLLRRPTYFPLIRNMSTQAEIGPQLSAAGLAVVSTRLFAPTTLLSPILRPFGLGAYCENLILVECVPAKPRHAPPEPRRGGSPR